MRLAWLQVAGLRDLSRPEQQLDRCGELSGAGEIPGVSQSDQVPPSQRQSNPFHTKIYRKNEVALTISGR